MVLINGHLEKCQKINKYIGNIMEKSREVCKKCGFKIRGKKHDDAAHHQKGSGGKLEVSKRRRR